MTEQLHPMVPPNILLNNWESDWFAERENVDVLLIQAYQAGADAELEACCSFLKKEYPFQFEAKWEWIRVSDDLRAARRPSLQSLKEQALSEVATAVACGSITPERGATIRFALEALPND